MFAWIIYTRRPLQVNELQDAVAFTSEDRFWDRVKIPSDTQRLIRACGNLILIDDVSGNVQLAHYTVQQYLLVHNTTSHFVREFSLHGAEAEIGHVCVAYLSFSDFETQVVRYTHCTTDATTNFSNLEAVARQGAFLTPSPTANKLGAVVKAMRGHQLASTGINYAKYLEDGRAKAELMSTSMTLKYSLLSYVVKNWLYHTNSKSFIEIGRTKKTIPNRQIEPFYRLVREKHLLFDFRPWEKTEPQRNGFQDSSDLGPLGWAIYHNHLPVLKALINESDPNHI
ncbi:hypothetical protein B0J14DRAFT_674168 [Halenospora varia]|nr:hypothetical protein B0J14DRAFT_674168 [Halenospora varia]